MGLFTTEKLGPDLSGTDGLVCTHVDVVDQFRKNLSLAAPKIESLIQRPLFLFLHLSGHLPLHRMTRLKKFGVRGIFSLTGIGEMVYWYNQ
jgi:hypothetical protein